MSDRMAFVVPPEKRGWLKRLLARLHTEPKSDKPLGGSMTLEGPCCLCGKPLTKGPGVFTVVETELGFAHEVCAEKSLLSSSSLRTQEIIRGAPRRSGKKCK